MWNFKKNFFKTVIAENQNVVIIPDFDYAVFTYQFFDGRDLDTWTRPVLPLAVANLSSPNHYLGYSKNKCVPDSPLWTGNVIPPNIYMDWAGDNTGIGFESVFIDLKKIKEDFPTENLIKVDLRCAWYGEPGVLPVEVKSIFYKGGEMIKNSNQYLNLNFSEKIEFTTNSKVITTRFQSSVLKERFATFTFDKNTGIGSFDLNDIITPTL